MRQTLILFYSTFFFCTANAQTFEVGIYAGKSHFIHTSAKSLAVTTTTWDNEPFVRFEYKRFSIETAIGQFPRNYTIIGNASSGEPDFKEYHYTETVDVKDFQWNILLQYRFCQSKSKRFKYYAGISWTTFTENVNMGLEYFYLRDSTITFHDHSKIVDRFGYLGANLRATYSYKRFRISALAQIKNSQIGDLQISYEGLPLFFPKIPDLYYTFQIGISYAIK